jgi:hypothetical protein
VKKGIGDLEESLVGEAAVEDVLLYRSFFVDGEDEDLLDEFRRKGSCIWSRGGRDQR